MPKLDDNEFVIWLAELRECEHYQALLSKWKDQNMRLTKAVMNSKEDRTFDRGKAVGIEWCYGLIDNLISEYNKQKDTDQGTSDT